ncbi:Uncaracterized surface protein containing fasciclin (FAS1) repeats [Halpernia frigidisoli]|uniref:Uncaracterized surface protein containing fasciclin (FAS1) repeats n=2 Tax=Halpernia frigidisoli TaxID=1125876 RepID=A0A1I3D3Y6_9FLAO|nr:Uncaracterized surface protein containing fasciclin (FAS1) repeats [Halpernia frigidisoli]
MNYSKITTSALAVLMTFGLANQASAQKMMTKQKTVMVGGAAMYPTKNIIENAVNSKDHTTLVAAVKAAGLVETLSGKGPFTVFAPTNAAFEKLPAGTVESVLQPENKATLTSILTYHVIARKISSKDLAAWIAKGKGKYTAKTVQGEKLTFTASGKNIYVSDMKGNKAKVTIADVNQSNGVIHVIDTVLMP